MKAAVVAFRKYQCHNVGTLLPTHGSIGLAGLGLGEGGNGTGEIRTRSAAALGTGQPWRNVPDKIVAPVAAFWWQSSDHHLVLTLPGIWDLHQLGGD